MKENFILNPQETNEYQMPTTVYFGRDSFDKLKSIIKGRRLNKVLFVIGSHLKKEKKVMQIINQIKQELNVLIYEQQIRKSDYSTVNNLTDFCRNQSFNAIIAVGGGAVIDSSKSAAILSVHDGLVEEYVVRKSKDIINKGIFFIAVPTTAGTGSEVTPWATVWGDDNKKYSLSSKYMFPDIAIVDPKLTDSMNKEQTAQTGMDALTQAVESYWNVNHNSISDKYALDAIKIIISNLEKAVNNPDESVRNNMSKGSLFSGLAFSNTQTTICHSISYPMTAHWNIPHGQAVSITLPSFIEYTLPILNPERREVLLSAIGVKTEKDASGKIKNLMNKIGLKTKLSDLGITQKDIDLIVEEGFNPDRAKNAPRIPTNEELKKILLILE